MVRLYIKGLVLVHWDLNSADKRDSSTGLIKFLDLELLLELCARDLNTVNNDGRILREEGVDGVVEILFLGGIDDRADVVLSPLSKSRKDNVSGHN